MRVLNTDYHVGDAHHPGILRAGFSDSLLVERAAGGPGWLAITAKPEGCLVFGKRCGLWHAAHSQHAGILKSTVV